MGFGGFSDSEVATLNSKFSAFDKALDSARQALSSQIRQISDYISNLKATGTTILDEPTLKGLFDSVKADFAAQQEKLSSAIKVFQDATKAYDEKRNVLLEKEEELIKRESMADQDFAAKRELQMAPLRRLQEELDAKQKYLIDLQNDYTANYQKREVELQNKYDELFKQLQANFSKLQAELNSARVEIARRENNVSAREKNAMERETEIKEGLAQEREKMLEGIAQIDRHVEEKYDELNEAKSFFKQAQDEFENQKRDLQDRIDKVYLREREADEGFATKRKEMQDDIEALREKCQASIREEEKQAAELRNHLWEDTMKAIDAEKSRSVAALQEILEKEREIFQAKIDERQGQIDKAQQDLDDRAVRINEKETELKKREEQIKMKEEEQKSEKSFLADKMRIDEERFRKIADERIKGVLQEKQSVEQARDSLAEQLIQMRLRFEEQKSINDRFKDKSAEEIYARINALEAENERLMLQAKNQAAVAKSMWPPRMFRQEDQGVNEKCSCEGKCLRDEMAE